jgi:NTF2 fold immunity protein
MTSTFATVLLASCLVIGSAVGDEERFGIPEQGFVPDAVTAIRIADAVLIPIYGDDAVASQRPLVASLVGETWYVSGTLPKPSSGTVVVGGVAHVEISKYDGRILRVAHGQ